MCTDMNIRFLTDRKELIAAWPQVAQLLEPVVRKAARGEFTLANILEMAADGKAVIGVVKEGDEMKLAFVFEFRHYPQMTAVNVIAIGGRNLRRAAAAYLETLASWARSAGASCIDASCSPAMARLLAKLQFTDTYRRVRRMI